MIKCGLKEVNRGEYQDISNKSAYIYLESDWKHDDYEHVHQRFQLSFVEEGYQYFHIDDKVYLVPQNYVIWIPSGKRHRVSSEADTVNLVVVLYNDVPDNTFFQQVRLFQAPPILRDMLLYASRWNEVVDESEDESSLLDAILKNLGNFYQEKSPLSIPVPSDERLISVCMEIDRNYDAEFRIAGYAQIAGMSIRSLQRVFRKETGISLYKYLQLVRVLKSIELIETMNFTLTEIAYKVGYRSVTAFVTSYRSVMKESPRLRKRQL